MNPHTQSKGALKSDKVPSQPSDISAPHSQPKGALQSNKMPSQPSDFSAPQSTSLFVALQNVTQHFGLSNEDFGRIYTSLHGFVLQKHHTYPEEEIEIPDRLEECQPHIDFVNKFKQLISDPVNSKFSSEYKLGYAAQYSEAKEACQGLNNYYRLFYEQPDFDSFVIHEFIRTFRKATNGKLLDEDTRAQLEYYYSLVRKVDHRALLLKCNVTLNLNLNPICVRNWHEIFLTW